MPHHPIRRMRSVAVAAGTATVVAAAALATAAPGGAHTAAAQAARRHAAPAHAAWGRRIHVIEHAITDFENPNGTDAKGNVLTFNNPVYAYPANRRKVGHDEGFCVRLQVKLGIWECLWTTFLKGGQITVQGPYYDTRNSVLTITGGTGAYEGAGGQMTLLSRNGGKQYDFIFHMVEP